MRRGAGVWRENSYGVWREWDKIKTYDQIVDIRRRMSATPSSVRLLENRELLDRFRQVVKSESEAVELANACSVIFDAICQPAEDGELVQMPRDDLDLLTNLNSTAKGIRERGKTKEGTDKKKSGRKSSWPMDKAAWETAKTSDSSAHFLEKLKQHPDLKDAFGNLSSGGSKKLEYYKKLAGSAPWKESQSVILEKAARWKEAKQEREEKEQDSSEHGSKAAYRRLFDAGCLPMPEFAKYIDENQIEFGDLKLSDCGAEWKRGMWNQAGQRVRSHMGWQRRREKENAVYSLRKELFEKGGAIRRKKSEELTPEDILPGKAAPDQNDWQERPAYGNQMWFIGLRSYEENEMAKYAEEAGMGSRSAPRIRRGTIKGWSKLRERWLQILKRNPQATRDDLIGELNALRSQDPRAYGDARLFDWLSKTDQRFLWDGFDADGKILCGRDDRDCVSAFVAYNEEFADEPSSITLTETDERLHPVWPFFGESSAVPYEIEYDLETACPTAIRLPLLVGKENGGYAERQGTRLPLAEYADLASSFQLPTPVRLDVLVEIREVTRAGRKVTCPFSYFKQNGVWYVREGEIPSGESIQIKQTDRKIENGKIFISSKLRMAYRDDLMVSPATGDFGSIKILWERIELASHVDQKKLPETAPARSRVFVSFSCNVVERAPRKQLTRKPDAVVVTIPSGVDQGLVVVSTDVRTGKSKSSSAPPLPPGSRLWPADAVHGDPPLRILSVDLGHRHSAYAVWELGLQQKSWRAGVLKGSTQTPVYADCTGTGLLCLPGDGEDTPAEEESLRLRSRQIRRRLNLQNSILRVSRLLSLDKFEKTIFEQSDVRDRPNKKGLRIRRRCRTEKTPLSEAEVRKNCDKAAEILIRWADTDAMAKSLAATGNADISFWKYMAVKNPPLSAVVDVAPSTIVPDDGPDRETLKKKRQEEEEKFASSIYENRVKLAGALCSGYDADHRRPATGGLWHDLDRTLIREISYGDRGQKGNPRKLNNEGILRLLRRPPRARPDWREFHRTLNDANRIPKGRTLRGGLSMGRLNFLKEVGDFVKKWSCRPRWPGDRRHIPPGQLFDRQDAEHLEHLRDDRIKRLAHLIVAQALGFEPDIRRGLWKYVDGSTGEILWQHPETRRFFAEGAAGELREVSRPAEIDDDAAARPHTVSAPAHIVVFENLIRYRFQSDRPKTENAGLMQWAHRQIVHFTKQVASLYGLKVAMVYAAFSSKFCSRCGSPGARVSRFDPAWRNQEWFKRRTSNPRSKVDHSLKRASEDPTADETRPWVLIEGGKEFVCANAKCSAHDEPLNADENAAANIGLRFLRGVEDFRTKVNPAGALKGKLRFETGIHSFRPPVSGSPFWSPMAEPAQKKKIGAAAPGADVDEAGDADESGVVVLFRDPSGAFRNKQYWYEGKIFWSNVMMAVEAKIAGASVGAKPVAASWGQAQPQSGPGLAKPGGD